MPLLDQWQRWVRQVSDELQSILPTGYAENGGMCAFSDPISRPEEGNRSPDRRSVFFLVDFG